MLGRIWFVLQGATSSPHPGYSPALDLANFMPLCRGNRCLEIRSHSEAKDLPQHWSDKNQYRHNRLPLSAQFGGSSVQFPSNSC